MNSNTHSIRPMASLTALAAVVNDLAAQDPDGLSDAVRAERVLVLRRLLDRLEGHWLIELAGVDARGAAGAEAGVQAGSTAGWLRARLRMGAAAASNAVRTARALFAGPLPQTGQALTHGALTPAHAGVLAVGTHDLPAQVTAEAEPVLVEAARRLDPARLRRVLGHLRLVADPDTADRQTQRRHARRGLWLASTLDNMVAVDGLLEAEAGQILLAALEPLTRPHSAADPRSGGQRRADALAELARRTLEGGRLPQTGGVRPQLLVTVDLDSLQGRPGLGGDTDAGPLAPEACRRLACDGTLTRVLVTRHPTGHHGHEIPADHEVPSGHDVPSSHPGHDDLGSDENLTARLRTAAALLPSVLGGAPTQPLEVGRTSRVVTPPNVLPWPSATTAVSSPAAIGPWPGAKPTTCATGSPAAPPTWPTWPWCAEPTTGRSTRGLAAGPRPRRPTHHHPTPPTTPKTARRGLTGRGTLLDISNGRRVSGAACSAEACLERRSLRAAPRPGECLEPGILDRCSSASPRPARCGRPA